MLTQWWSISGALQRPHRFLSGQGPVTIACWLSESYKGESWGDDVGDEVWDEVGSEGSSVGGLAVMYFSWSDF